MTEPKQPQTGKRPRKARAAPHSKECASKRHLLKTRIVQIDSRLGILECLLKVGANRHLESCRGCQQDTESVLAGSLPAPVNMARRIGLGAPGFAGALSGTGGASNPSSHGAGPGPTIQNPVYVCLIPSCAHSWSVDRTTHECDCVSCYNAVHGTGPHPVPPEEEVF